LEDNHPEGRFPTFLARHYSCSPVDDLEAKSYFNIEKDEEDKPARGKITSYV